MSNLNTAIRAGIVLNETGEIFERLTSALNMYKVLKQYDEAYGKGVYSAFRVDSIGNGVSKENKNPNPVRVVYHEYELAKALDYHNELQEKITDLEAAAVSVSEASDIPDQHKSLASTLAAEEVERIEEDVDKCNDSIKHHQQVIARLNKEESSGKQ